MHLRGGSYDFSSDRAWIFLERYTNSSSVPCRCRSLAVGDRFNHSSSSSLYDLLLVTGTVTGGDLKVSGIFFEEISEKCS